LQLGRRGAILARMAPIDLVALAIGVLEAPQIHAVADRLAHLGQLLDDEASIAEVGRVVGMLRTIGDAVGGEGDPPMGPA
jgi:hypothetical protein